MTILAPEWVRTSDPVIRSPARYRWTTAPAGARPRKMDQPVDDERGATSGRGGEEDTSPVAALEDTVFRMQRDMEELQLENRFLRTPRVTRPVPLVRQAALTTTKVPWFNGSTSWEQ